MCACVTPCPVGAFRGVTDAWFQVPKLWTRDPDWGGGRKAEFLRKQNCRSSAAPPAPPSHTWRVPSKWTPAPSQEERGRGRAVLIDHTVMHKDAAAKLAEVRARKAASLRRRATDSRTPGVWRGVNELLERMGLSGNYTDGLPAPNRPGARASSLSPLGRPAMSRSSSF